MTYLLSALFVLFAFSSVQAQAVKITVKPNPIYIEKTSAAQNLNFDFILENTTKESLSLSKVEVSVFDSKDKLVLRKFIDGNGVRPSIMTVPNRELEAHTPLLIFNPFYSFLSDAELTRMVYEFTFETKDRKKQFVSSAEISPVFYQTKTNLILPVKGRSIIFDGHDFYAHHRRFDYMFAPIAAFGFKTNFMRYSYDFVPVKEDGGTFQGDEKSNASYFGFGANLYASGDGKIVSVVDDKPDNRSFDESKLATDRMVLFGNYVVIDHLNGEYSLYGHIKQGSSKVKIGDTVKQNQIVAQIGASGSSMFPHLHYELQNGANTDAEGLPSYFRNFQKILGAKTHVVKLGQIDSGDIVQR